MPISGSGIVGRGIVLPWIERQLIVRETIVNPGYGPVSTIVMAQMNVIHVNWGKAIVGIPAAGDIIVYVEGKKFTGKVTVVMPVSGPNTMDIVLDRDMQGGARITWKYTGHGVTERSGREVSHDPHRVNNRLLIAVVHMTVPVFYKGKPVYHTP